MARRPGVVLFDVIETLFSLAPVENRLRTLGLGERPLELWFPAFLRDGFALAASGTYQPFRVVAERSLRSVMRRAERDLSTAEVETVLDAFSVLDPHPDAQPALRRLRDAGIRTMTLSNGSAEATSRLLTRSGLERVLHRCRPRLEATAGALPARLPPGGRSCRARRSGRCARVGYPRCRLRRPPHRLVLPPRGEFFR